MELQNRHWVKKIESWKESGLSKAEYCRREGINQGTFSTWSHRYKTQIEEVSKGFVEITPKKPEESSSEPSSDYPVEISAGGLSVKINGDADSSLIENIFKALEARLCS